MVRTEEPCEHGHSEVAEEVPGWLLPMQSSVTQSGHCFNKLASVRTTEREGGSVNVYVCAQWQ